MNFTKIRTTTLAAVVVGAGVLGAVSASIPANAATPAISGVKVTPGGQQVVVAFNLTGKGFSGVEIGRAPLTAGHNTYAQQYGDFVNGANGVAYATKQSIRVDGLMQQGNYWATIQYNKGTAHKYKRNIPFTTLRRQVTVHVSSLYIDGDGDISGCGEVQAITHINTVPFVYPYGVGWTASNWTPQESICTQGYLPNTFDFTIDVGTQNNLSISTGAVDDDSLFGCFYSFSCGDNAFAQTNVSTAPLANGTESYSSYFSMQGYEYGGIGPVAGELGVQVSGYYTVSYH